MRAALATSPARDPYSYSDSMLRWRIGKCLRADDLREKGFRRGIAVQHAVLGAFLVIEHELQRDARVGRATADAVDARP